ncbi:MAG: hypothetical protein V1837_07760 [Candidatus Woesearchaeota archaeon]
MDLELHMHPFNNLLEDIVHAMDSRKIGILAVESLDASIFPRVRAAAKSLYSNLIIDDAGVKLPSGKTIWNGREYSTSEGFHLLTIGYSLDTRPYTEIRRIIDISLKHNAQVILDHGFVDNNLTRTAGHISRESEFELNDLCKEYRKEIALEWNAYCKPWMRASLLLILNALGHKTRYYDVNKKVVELSKSINNFYGPTQTKLLPILTGTDLHAIQRKMLELMGTARVKADVQGESPSEILASFKELVRAGKYENTYDYVGFVHLLEAFCLPKLFFKDYQGL